MKKLTDWLLVFFFSLSLVLPGLAQSLKDKQAELNKIRQHLYQLDTKIKQARAARHINKLAELKELKRAELARAKTIKEEIAKAEKASLKPAQALAKAGKQKPGFLAEGGYGAGGLLLRGGYLKPLRSNLDLIVDVGLGIGSGFSVAILDLATRFGVGRGFVGLELTMASYSKTVRGVAGLSGNIGGSNTGIGLYGGTAFGVFEGKVGYNTAIGLNASAGYKF